MIPHNQSEMSRAGIVLARHAKSDSDKNGNNANDLIDTPKKDIDYSIVRKMGHWYRYYPNYVWFWFTKTTAAKKILSVFFILVLLPLVCLLFLGLITANSELLIRAIVSIGFVLLFAIAVLTKGKNKPEQPSSQGNFLAKILKDFAQTNGLRFERHAENFYLYTVQEGTPLEIEMRRRTMVAHKTTQLPELLIMRRGINSLTHVSSQSQAGLKGENSHNFSRSQRFELEGSFAKDFDIFAPLETQQVALMILTPDIMEKMQLYDCTVQINGDSLIYTSKKTGSNVFAHKSLLDLESYLPAFLATQQVLSYAIDRYVRGAHTRLEESSINHSAAKMLRYTDTPGFKLYALVIIGVSIVVFGGMLRWAVSAEYINSNGLLYTLLLCLALAFVVWGIFYFVIGRFYSYCYYLLHGDLREKV